MQDCKYSWMYMYAHTSACYQMHTDIHQHGRTYRHASTVTHHPSSVPHPCTIPHADGRPSTRALSQPWFILTHAMPIMSCIHVTPLVLACIQPSMPLAHVPMPMS